MSVYGSRGPGPIPGSIPGCAPIFQCIFASIFSVLMLNYFILVKLELLKLRKVTPERFILNNAQHL